MYDPRNATASWSGYLHQGKVGIFVALRKIVELIDGKTENEAKEALSKWRIIYENAEDFDIQEKDDDGPYIDSDGSWRVDSRHQVKAYKDGKNLNDYKDVLNIQKVVMKIPNGKTEPERVLGIKGFQIRRFQDMETEGDCTPLDIEVDEDSRFLHSIVKIQGFGLTKTDFDLAKNTGIITGRPKFISNPNKVKLYLYPDGSNYCNITSSPDNLKSWCNGEIEKIKGDNLTGDIYKKLLCLLDEQIRYSHVQSGNPTLYFLEIYKFIKEEHNKVAISKLQEIKEAYSYYYEEYKKNIETIVPGASVDRIKIIDKYMEELYRLSNKDFLLSLKIMNLDKNIEKYMIPNIDGFRDVILKFIGKLNTLDSLEHFNSILGKHSLRMTCINQDEENISIVVEALKDNIRNGYLSNDDFEGYSYVNRNINSYIDKFNISDSEDPRLTISGHYVDDLHRKFDNPNIRSGLGLISRESALNKVNNI